MLAVQAASEAEHLRCSRTWSDYQRMYQYFDGFLAAWGDVARASWATCTPEVVLVFLRTRVLAEVTARDGGPACPGTIESLASALSMVLQYHGRQVAWDETAGTGNPVQSLLVRNFLGAYRRERLAAGQQPHSAVPLSEAKFGDLIAALDAEIDAVDHSRWDAALKLLQLERGRRRGSQCCGPPGAAGLMCCAPSGRGCTAIRVASSPLITGPRPDGGGELPPLLLLCPTASKTAPHAPARDSRDPAHLWTAPTPPAPSPDCGATTALCSPRGCLPRGLSSGR